MTSPRSIAQAKRAANVGAEAWLDLAHEKYRVQGRAVIARCHFPVRGAPGHMFPVGKGDTDFVGIARAEERVLPVAFDLKVHRHASYMLDITPKAQGGKPEVLRQVQLLVDFWRVGGVGFLGLLDPVAGELWMLGQRPLTWLLEHPNQFFKYRARVGEAWAGEPGTGIVCVREADTLMLARTGIRYDWLTALPQLLPPLFGDTGIEAPAEVIGG